MKTSEIEACIQPQGFVYYRGAWVVEEETLPAPVILQDEGRVDDGADQASPGMAWAARDSIVGLTREK